MFDLPGIGIAKHLDSGKWVLLWSQGGEQYETPGGTIHEAIGYAQDLRDSLNFVIDQAMKDPEYITPATPTRVRGN